MRVAGRIVSRMIMVITSQMSPPQLLVFYTTYKMASKIECFSVCDHRYLHNHDCHDWSIKKAKGRGGFT